MEQARIQANRQAAARQLAAACLATDPDEQGQVLDFRALAAREQAIRDLAQHLETYACRVVAEMALLRRVSSRQE